MLSIERDSLEKRLRVSRRVFCQDRKWPYCYDFSHQMAKATLTILNEFQEEGSVNVFHLFSFSVLLGTNWHNSILIEWLFFPLFLKFQETANFRGREFVSSSGLKEERSKIPDGRFLFFSLRTPSSGWPDTYIVVCFETCNSFVVL